MRGFKDQFAVHRQTQLSGVLLTTSEYPGSVWRPKWSDSARMETHFRPVGPLTPDLKGFIPWRYSAEPTEFGPWLVMVPVFSGGTTRRYTVIAAFADPTSAGDALELTTHPTPITKFMDAAKRLAYNDVTGRLKQILLTGGNGRAAALPKSISPTVLMQGILLQHGENDYKKRPIFPAMMSAAGTAGEALLTLLNKPVDNYTGNADDYAARFVTGDVLDPKKGRVLMFFNANIASSGVAGQGQIDWQNAGHQSTSGEVRILPKYGCEISSYNGALPVKADGKLLLAESGNLFTPWEKALRFLNEQQMVELLCSAYADLPELLLACLKQYYPMLPNFVKGNATVTVTKLATPAATPQPMGVETAVASSTETVTDNNVIEWANALRGAEANGAGEEAEPDKTLAPPAGIPDVAKGAAAGISNSVLNDPAVVAALAKLRALKT